MMTTPSAFTIADRERPSPGQADGAANDAMDVLRQIVRALRVGDAEAEAASGVTSAQLFVLRAIGRAGTLTVGELATMTATAQSSASEVVARLASRRLIIRKQSSGDRRRTQISLSKAGAAVLARSPQPLQERLLAAFARLPGERQVQVASGLKTWVAEAGLGDVAPTMFFEPLDPRLTAGPVAPAAR
jgi:DNA-binding MarR family transcriptional regulator